MTVRALPALLMLTISSVLLPSASAADLGELAAAEARSLEELYKHLHSHPELSFHEEATAARIAGELRKAGYEVTTGFGGHGVVAVLRNGEGKTVMIRTDLDALPVVEETGKPYASKVRTKDDAGNDVGVMHACGHDMHMTAFVGAARLLAKLKDRWKGAVVAIAQPAEERGAGAKAMLAEGLYRRFPTPDAALALHVSAELPAGTVGYHHGYAMAAVDSVDITVRGLGGHGAYPHKTKDPIVLTAYIITALQTIASRETDPQDAVVVTVGSIHGGAKHNIIPPEVKLQLTVRNYSDKTRNAVLAAIRRITTETARAFGIPEDRLPVIEMPNEYTPATYNDPDLGRRLVSAWKKALGEKSVVEVPAVMASEDFSRYGRTPEKVPIYLFWLGTVERSRWEAAERGEVRLPALHSPLFAPEIHPTIETGVKAMTAAALAVLGGTL